MVILFCSWWLNLKKVIGVLSIEQSGMLYIAIAIEQQAMLELGEYLWSTFC